jgi:peptidoglycan/xylan/chitin deacetylase (PgdA/CDA1 family)
MDKNHDMEHLTRLLQVTRMIMKKKFPLCRLSSQIIWLVMAASLITGCSSGRQEEKIVVLTFDDATRSQLEFVAPLLKKKGFGATFFVSHAWMEDTVNFMQWDGVASLHKMGFEIGNHSWSHDPFITEKDIAAMEADLRRVDSALLANGVPKPISFAYPGNHFAPGTVEKIRVLGYRFARRGMQPEIPYGKIAHGPLFDPGVNDRLVIPTSADAYPEWTLDYFKSIFNRAEKGKALILQFHGVPDIAHPWVTTNPELFTQCMDYLDKAGVKVIAMKDLDKYFDIQDVDDPALKYTNGVPGQYNPCPVDADIWVLAGQSNMQGAGRTPDTLTDPKIWMMNLDDRWMVAQEPLHRIFEATASAYSIAFYQLWGNPEKSMEKTRQLFIEQAKISRQKPVGGVGPGMYFARHVLAGTNRSIGLIPCALGGSTIAQWDPAGTIHGDSSLYGAMLNRVRSAGTQHIKGLVWSQGESEAFIAQTETYSTKLLALIDSFRRDIGRPDLPVLIVQIGRVILRDSVMDHNWEAIRNIQLQLITKRPNLFLTTGIDLELDDCVHFSTRGNQRLGARLGELALTHVYGLPGHGDQIRPQSIALKKDSVSGSSYLLLHYQGVTGKLKTDGLPSCFEIRFGKEIRLSHVISKIQTDPGDGAGLRLYLSALPEEPVSLYCGAGTNPHMNITDSLDMPVPAFGPLEINFDFLNKSQITLK